MAEIPYNKIQINKRKAYRCSQCKFQVTEGNDPKKQGKHVDLFIFTKFRVSKRERISYLLLTPQICAAVMGARNSDWVSHIPKHWSHPLLPSPLCISMKLSLGG